MKTTIRVSGVLVAILAAFAALAQETKESSQPIINQLVAGQMGRTWGYCLGQTLWLDEIERKFPELTQQVRITRMEFDLVFGSSVTNIAKWLDENGGRDWQEGKEATRKQLLSGPTLKNLTLDQAKEYFEIVGRRTKGELPSPVIETLLVFNSVFFKNPEKEFVHGFKQKFFSDGTGKANGIKFRLESPRSWSSEKGNRPQVFHKFISQNGRGPAMIMIGILPIPGVQSISEQEAQETIDELLKPGGAKEWLPPGAALLSSGKIKLEGRPGAFLRYNAKQERLDTTLNLSAITYTLVFNNVLMQINCQVWGKPGDTKKIDAAFKKFEPVFRLVANSLVIEK